MISKKRTKTGVGRKQELPEYRRFSFRPIRIGRLQIVPQWYLSLLYLAVLVVGVYFLFFEQGLRRPQVQVRFYALSGAASLYVDDRFYSNLSPGNGLVRDSATVLLPAGLRKLRIEKAGMQPWQQEREFRTKIWNNRWNPRHYDIELKMEQQFGPLFLWREAWRSYLYRGLEGQKELAYDGSHPYPLVLSEGLRSLFYSFPAGQGASESASSAEFFGTLPPHWSADMQRGLASTSNIYQLGDLLTAFSLVQQHRSAALFASSVAQTNRIALLGPKALAGLARSAAQRLLRLAPYAESLRHSLASAAAEGSADRTAKTALAILQQWPGLAFPAVSERQDSPLKETEAVQQSVGSRLAPQTAFAFEDYRFVAVPGTDFAMMQTEVSNAQFARFWFRPGGAQARRQQQAQQSLGPYAEGVGATAPRADASISQAILYPADREGRPWDWGDSVTAASSAEQPDSLLYDLPVRGVTWQEAQEFGAWLQGQLPPVQQRRWLLGLPSSAQRRQLAALLEQTGAGAARRELDFQVPAAPPTLSSQAENALGLRGLSGSLWEWLADDFLLYPYTESQNGYSDLGYKTVAGGSWLNVLPIDRQTRTFWADEFLAQGQEVPAPASAATLAGLFSQLRSPYTGFRLLAVAKTEEP